MGSEIIKLRYDGPILDGHSIDVNDLAPALLALADLCKIANRKFNGDRASVNVLVNADLDQNCFELNLELAQTLYEHAKTILKNEDVASAKEILEWLGIVGGVTSASVVVPVGLFKLCVWMRNRKISEKELVTVEGKDLVKISVKDDGNGGSQNHIYVYPQTVQMMENPNAINAVKKVVKPAAQEGYDSVEFDAGNKENSNKISKEDAISIMAIDTSEPLVEIIEEANPLITAWVTVYAPVYDINAEKWRFEYGDNHEYMDISETEIAKDAIERGGCSVNDTYKVKLEISQSFTSGGKISNSYKIKEVLEFRPSRLTIQNNLFTEINDKP